MADLKVKSWSYSAWSLYELCPLQYKLTKIDKLPSPPSAAMARGDAVHKAAAAWIVGDTDIMPKELGRFITLAQELRDMPADIRVVEQQWGFTKEWRPSGWSDWQRTWLRVILDAGVVYPDGTADVVDHKTGKKYGTNAEQMELFGIATLRRYPHLSEVTTRLWYLDSGEEEVAVFHQENAGELIAKWEKRVEPMFSDTVFAPRPNDKCKWCNFSRSKGGPCRFG